MESTFQTFNKTFHDLHVAPKLLALLDKQGFKHPSFIQAEAIPFANQGEDVLGVAQTGTGKTMAFGLPILQRLTQISGRALVLAPTRELATQIFQALNKFAGPLNIHMALLIGGESIRPQIRQLSNARFIVATPGRLIDHLEQHTTRLDDVEIMVLDEADRMLDMGFLPPIQIIFKHVAKKRQTMLFSATMPSAIVEITHQYMNKPKKIEIAPEAMTAQNVTQELFVVSHLNKAPLLDKILAQYQTTAIIFCRTKIGTSKLAKHLRAKHIRCADIHSDKSQRERNDALDAFKRGVVKILVATDVAARGIDVKNIGLVINYDLPDEAANYVHRIGRTGRAGQSGHAISFACPDQGDLVKEIEKQINEPLKINQHADFPKEFLTRSKKSSGGRSGGASRGRRFPPRSHSSSSHHGSSRPSSHGARPSARPGSAPHHRKPASGARRPAVKR